MTLQMTPQQQASVASAAFTAAALMYMQDSPLDRSQYYRGDAGSMGPFENDGSYRKKAYAFKAVAAMLDTPRRLAATGGDREGFAVLAGRSEDGTTLQVLISNFRGAGGYDLNMKNLPAGEFSVKRYRVTATESWVEAEGSPKMSNPLPAPGLELITIRHK